VFSAKNKLKEIHSVSLGHDFLTGDLSESKYWSNIPPLQVANL